MRGEIEQEGIFAEDTAEQQEQKVIRQLALQDKVGQSLEARFPDPPKPEKLFQKFHKRRKPPTKAQLFKKATGYLNWEKAADAINTEKPD